MDMRSKVVNHTVSGFLRLCVKEMKRLGLNQTMLAKRMRISRPYVTKLLAGDVNISFAAAERLAHALGMDFVPGLSEREERIGRENRKI